jgi:tetratricopeptide (TPR) repeat protein
MRKSAKKITSARAPAAPVVAGMRFPVWLVAVFLALATIGLYWPAMRCDFITYDDPDYVTANPHIQAGLNWEGIKWAFVNTQQAGYWAPLMWLSHELACQLFGLNPWGHHLINVLLHAANTALVFLVFRRMTGAVWRSLMLATLFGWHPLQVESVAWVTERKDVLSAFFWMLTLWAYVEYVKAGEVWEPKTKVWYGTALVMLVFGLMSKAMLVTMPFVLLLLDYWPLQRFKVQGAWTPDRRLVMEKIPFLALALAASVMTIEVQTQSGAVRTFVEFPLGARIENALVSYCRYLGKIFWPEDLAIFYPHPGYWPWEQVLLAGAFLCGVSALLFVQRRRYPCLLFGWLWFVGTLVPVIQLVQSGEQAMADRFTYIPSLGVMILAIWGTHELTRGLRCQKIALSVAGSAAVIICLGLTRQQLGYWKDSVTLYRHALASTGNNYMAHNNLGVALDKKGLTDEAISQYQQAIRIKPKFVLAHYNLGVVLSEKGLTDEAIREYQECIRHVPNDALVHINLGNALLAQGRTDEAISQYQEAIRLKPDDFFAHNNLGIALGGKGQIDQAASQFQEAIRLKPDGFEACYNFGNALFKAGRTDEAIRQYREAIRIKPDFAGAHDGLGLALGREGKIDDAIAQFQETLRLKPDDADAQKNLAQTLELKSQSDGQPSGPVKP